MHHAHRNAFLTLLLIGVLTPASARAQFTGDFDGDGDVDLLDFRTFQLCFAGPNVQPPEICNPPFCGDGIQQAGEQCDDGNNNNGDGCNAACEIEENCTDKIDNDEDGLIDCDDPECCAIKGCDLTFTAAGHVIDKEAIPEEGLDDARVSIEYTLDMIDFFEAAFDLTDVNGDYVLVASVPVDTLFIQVVVSCVQPDCDPAVENANNYETGFSDLLDTPECAELIDVPDIDMFFK